MPKPTTRKLWDNDSELLLKKLWKRKPLEKIAAQLGRTETSVNQRANKLRLGKKRQGESMASFLRRTGYSQSRVHTAAHRLGIKLKRRVRTTTKERMGGKMRFYAISKHVAKRLIEYLRSVPDGQRIEKSSRGEWGGKKPLQCKRCKRSDKPHEAKGLCGRCYDRKRRRTKPRVKLPKTLWGFGKRPKLCESCKRIDRPYCARGHCKTCYYRKTK